MNNNQLSTNEALVKHAGLHQDFLSIFSSSRHLQDGSRARTMTFPKIGYCLMTGQDGSIMVGVMVDELMSVESLLTMVTDGNR